MNNEEKILELLTKMSERQDQTECILLKMDNRLSTIETKVDKLQDDISEVKANVRLLWGESVRHDKILDKIAK